MYCVKCGVELSDSEKKCPLCSTIVYHPTVKQGEAKPPFPKDEPIKEEFNRNGILFILSFIFAIPLALTFVIDFSINSKITWSGYAIFAILLSYIIVVLPIWFKKPHPIAFILLDESVVCAYLFYINYSTDGNWFLTLALPLLCMISILVNSVIALTRYLKHRYLLLYVYGGASVLLGGFIMLIEYFINLTFSISHGFVWSLYPLIVFFIVGVMLIIIAISKPLRESLYKKFFI